METKRVERPIKKQRVKLGDSPVKQTKGQTVGAQRKDQDVGFGGSKAQIASVKVTSAARNTC